MRRRHWRYILHHRNHRDPGTAQRELRREAVSFGAISVVCIALAITYTAADESPKLHLIAGVALGLTLIVLLPVSAISLALAWLRWRRSR